MPTFKQLVPSIMSDLTSYVTKNCVWPSLSKPVDQGIKDVIVRYYELCDDRDPDAGPKQAREVFSEDAVIEGVSGTFRGSAGKCIHVTYGLQWCH